MREESASCTALLILLYKQDKSFNIPVSSSVSCRERCTIKALAAMSTNWLPQEMRNSCYFSYKRKGARIRKEKKKVACMRIPLFLGSTIYTHAHTHFFYLSFTNDKRLLMPGFPTAARAAIATKFMDHPVWEWARVCVYVFVSE